MYGERRLLYIYVRGDRRAIQRGGPLVRHKTDFGDESGVYERKKQRERVKMCLADFCFVVDFCFFAFLDMGWARGGGRRGEVGEGR